MRKGPVKTYGRHRNRVIAADVWISDTDKKTNVFSTSSEFDSSKHSSLFHISDSSGKSLDSSGNSVDTSAFSSRTTRNYNKNARKPSALGRNAVSNDKENQGTGRGRRLANKKLNGLISTQGNYTSSSDNSAGADGSVFRRALRVRNKQVDYVADIKQKQRNPEGVKRKRPERKTQAKQPLHVEEADINFSDFDNYSLIVSGSPPVNGKTDGSKMCIDTSTPVAKRTRCKDLSVGKFTNPNVSGILHVESPCSSVGVSPADSASSRSALTDRLSLSSVGPSPLSTASSWSSSVRHDQENSSSFHSPENAVVIADRLTESFINLHVSSRRGSKLSTFDNSASLFGSYSKHSPVVGRSLTDPLVKLSEHLKKSYLRQTRNRSWKIEECSEHSVEQEEEKEDEVEEEEEGEVAEEEGEEEEGEEEEEEGTESLSILVEEEEDSDIDEDVSDADPDCASSNTTLYMFNDEKRSGKGASQSQSDMSCFTETSEDDVSVSDYITANTHLTSVGDVRDCTQTSASESESDAENDDSDAEKSLDDDAEPVFDTSINKEVNGYSSPAPNHHLKGQYLQSLQNSFSEMLTPTKPKGCLVPVSSRSKLLLLCDQVEPISFDQCLPGSVMKKCVKIGEGVYGEVFRSENHGKSVALKIIPIEGDFCVNDEPQKKFEEMIPEIVIAKELSSLRDQKVIMTCNFCQVNSVSCVRGRYPSHLLKQWDIFHKNKCSENDRPDMFTDKQLFIVFEFADCGAALESYEFKNLQQARSVLTQVAFALAVAEEAVQFEHRDLHWGNVLVRPTQREYVHFHMLGRQFSVPTMGVEANIIDFTLSRLRKDGCTVYNDLSSDETLFQGKGDYQFDIYRKMREENEDNWETFKPYTNVLWLHYLTQKLIFSARYSSAQSSRQERDFLRQFRQFHASVLSYHSACELAVDSLFLNS